MKPCPFCGETKELGEWNTGKGYDGCSFIHVRCNYCGALGPECDTYPKAKKAWDERVPGDTITEKDGKVVIGLT